MSWLRIDDGFAEHYKISELTDKEFRVWVRLLCYAARNNGRAGRLTAAMRREVVGLTDAMTKRFVTLGLLDNDDDDEGVLAVHDWRAYNPKDPTAADRAKRYRNRDADRDEMRDASVTQAVTETVPRARARARDTVPSRPVSTSSVSENSAVTSHEASYEATELELEASRYIERDDDGEPFKITEMTTYGGAT